jgi:hypothetical protein
LHKTSLALIALSVGLFSASQAKASTTDTFTLKGDGNDFQFSLTLPATPSPATGHSCPVFSSGGDFCYTGVSVTDNNGPSKSDTIEFTNNGGLDIFDKNGAVVELTLDHPPLYFSGTGSSASFIGGTYALGGADNGKGEDGWDYWSNCGNNYDGYSLNIDPPSTSPVPEPSSLALMSSGLLAAAGAVRRRMKK